MKRIIIIALLIGAGVIGTLLFQNVLSPKHNAEKVILQQEVPAVQAVYTPELAVQGPDFTLAAEKTVHAVVHIQSEFVRRSVYDDFFAPFRDFFGDSYYNNPRPYTGYGSGVIISADGFIVTNNHVVENATKVQVTLNDKRTFPAEIIGTDPTTDLAVIKVDGADLPYVVYGNSDDVKIGEWVLAVGNPFNLTSTVTAGIVSAKARNINILGTPGAIETFIQTDAAVNVGNSGGALVNTSGELIGINAAIATNTGAYTGYSFAVPVNIVRKVTNDLISYGNVQRAYLGVIIQDVTAELAKEKGFDDVRGIYVERVSDDGGAQDAGIRGGDVIISVEQHPINTTAQLLEVVGQHRPGDVLDVKVLRDGRELAYQVELRNESGNTEIMEKESEFYISDLGARFEEVTEDEKSRLRITGGLKVAELQDGLLRNGGVKEGYIILEINDIKISSKDDVSRALNNVYGGIMKVEGIYPNGMRMNYGFVL